MHNNVMRGKVFVYTFTPFFISVCTVLVHLFNLYCFNKKGHNTKELLNNFFGLVSVHNPIVIACSNYYMAMAESGIYIRWRQAGMYVWQGVAVAGGE